MAMAVTSYEREALFREVNQRIRALEQQYGREDDEQTEFICGCGSADCSERVPMTLRDYEQVRSRYAQFLVAPTHLDQAHARVVRDRGGYLVVEKVDVAICPR